MMQATIFLVLSSILITGQALAAVPAITDATERGEQLTISSFRRTLPDLYNFDTVPLERLGEGITRQTIHNANSTIAKWVFARNAVIPLHHHLNEQITWITAGSVEVFSQGKRFVVSAGQIIVFPANVPHEFRALEDGTVDIDIFTPARQDWIDGTANYIKPDARNR
ncbi:cupin domain-containing protein [Burkholderia ambifaria]|uniref:Cupin 2 conserved barrel domain protein n=1 Tax=Burkholderia ambifaria MEX-5 TaxID=396597 RepID=B1T1E6_9BURK|nr:cupin domain-containing protein [Burkholderia ambifaria]EDT42579.1 Cupin 2 conserved barrel domain protein [Burkholderia ambifaria MEX-5]